MLLTPRPVFYVDFCLNRNCRSLVDVGRCPCLLQLGPFHLPFGHHYRTHKVSRHPVYTGHVPYLMIFVLHTVLTLSRCPECLHSALLFQQITKIHQREQFFKFNWASYIFICYSWQLLHSKHSVHLHNRPARDLQLFSFTSEKPGDRQSEELAQDCATESPEVSFRTIQPRGGALTRRPHWLLHGGT